MIVKELNLSLKEKFIKLKQAKKSLILILSDPTLFQRFHCLQKIGYNLAAYSIFQIAFVKVVKFDIFPAKVQKMPFYYSKG